jgi:hypothetical protein
VLDTISPRLDAVEKSVRPGTGRLDLGLVGAPDHVGIGLGLEHRLLSPDLSMFAEAQARYDWTMRSVDWGASAGLRLRW